MPYLEMTFSHAPYETVRNELMREASRLVAAALGKAESYVCVSVREASMLFGGENSPAAFLELRSIGGLDPATNATLSRELCDLLEREADVPPERIFLNFVDVGGSSWGWNKKTFA